MPDYNDKATANPGTANRGIPGSGTTTAASAPGPITLRVAMGAWSFEAEVIKQLEEALRVRLTADPAQLAFREKLREYPTDFYGRRGRADKKFITLYFTLPKGLSWADIRRNPTLLYTHVYIRHELQVEDERQRLEQERREDARDLEEKRRATADRLAQEAVRERKRQAAEQKIKKLTIKIAGDTMFWVWGTVYGTYLNGDFIISYVPISEHENIKKAIQLANSAEHRHKLERALWDAYRQPGAMMTIYQVPVPSVPASTPPPSTSTATDNCSDPNLLDNDSGAYYKCSIKGPNQEWAEGIRQGAMSVTEPGAAFLEALNPFDPVNLAMAPFLPMLIGSVVSKGWKVVGTLVKGSKTRRIIEFISRSKGSLGRVARIEGDMSKFLASRRQGHHVYEYFAKNGKLLYVGKSGGVLGPKDPSRLAENWLDRLMDDHIKTEWIFDARSVRVTTEISEQEMWALEHILIPTARENKQKGQYYRWFEDGDLYANAKSAQTQPQVFFSIEVVRGRSR